MANNPIFPATVKNFGVTFVAADSTTPKTLVTAGSAGAIVDVMSLTTTETTSNTLIVQLYNGSTSYDFTEISLSSGAGTLSATKSINGLNVTDSPALGNREDRAITLATSWTLRGKVKAAVAGGKVVTVSGCYGDY